MEKAKDDDFGGLIEFLVRELAIKDWNKGMRASCFFFVSLVGGGEGRHGACDIGRDEEEEEEEDAFEERGARSIGIYSHEHLRVAATHLVVWCNGNDRDRPHSEANDLPSSFSPDHAVQL